MTSIRKTLMLACAVSVLGLGAAVAQTDPNAAPAAPAAGAPAGGAMSAPAGGDMQDATSMPKKKPMMKKHMAKKHMKKKSAM